MRSPRIGRPLLCIVKRRCLAVIIFFFIILRLYYCLSGGLRPFVLNEFRFFESLAAGFVIWRQKEKVGELQHLCIGEHLVVHVAVVPRQVN